MPFDHRAPALTRATDFCDEIGLLVYEESYAAWHPEDSPRMEELFDRSVREMILRDRNHPSVVMWGLLNETFDGPVFRHAVQMLPMVRALDTTRIVMLSSARSDFAPDIWRYLPEWTALPSWNSSLAPQPNLTYNKTKNPIQAFGGNLATGTTGIASRSIGRVRCGPLDGSPSRRIYSPGGFFRDCPRCRITATYYRHSYFA